MGVSQVFGSKVGAYVFKSTQAAVKLAQENPRYKVFANNLIEMKNVAAMKKLEKACGNLDVAEKKFAAARNRFPLEYSYVKFPSSFKPATNYEEQKAHDACIETFRREIAPAGRKVVEAKVDIRRHAEKVGKYDGLMKKMNGTDIQRHQEISKPRSPEFGIPE